MTKLLWCLFGISACFVLGTVARIGIINGELVRSNLRKFSYQVAIITSVNLRLDSLCGGGIIDDKFILTAAHCILNRDHTKGLLVIAGTVDLHDMQTAEKASVKKIFWPARINESEHLGDIAVLMLNHTLRLPHHRNWKLHLPTNDRASYEGAIAEIAGFGSYRIDARGVGIIDEKLRFAKAKVASHMMSNVPDEILIAQVIRHGYSRPRGISDGDSGSPLVYEGTVIGICIAGPPAEIPESFGSYTRVTYNLNFIRNAIRNIETGDMATIEFVL